VRTGLWDAGLGRAYDFLLELRDAGDYGGIVQVRAQDAEKALEKAQAILDAVKRIAPQLEQATG
jgi:uncharacterized protein (UPF0332 family)